MGVVGRRGNVEQEREYGHRESAEKWEDRCGIMWKAIRQQGNTCLYSRGEWADKLRAIESHQ